MVKNTQILIDMIVNLYVISNYIWKNNISIILPETYSPKFLEVILVFRVFRLFNLIDYMGVIFKVIKNTYKTIFYLAICNEFVLIVFTLFGKFFFLN